MPNPSKSSTKPNYGIDAPGIVLRLCLFGLLAIALGSCSLLAFRHGVLQSWTRITTFPLLTMGAYLFGCGLIMIWGSKVGKLQLRDKMLNEISWRGDELVLDVGCGHGLMLIGAAKRLRTGKAIGIDLWQKVDQAGNSREATQANVNLENVADRVELKDGDARKLPFANNTFDVILSSWALHNIYDAPGRETAVREIIRVLKPGGRLVIIDIQKTQEYVRILKESGMRDLRRRGPNLLFAIPTFIVTASKSA